MTAALFRILDELIAFPAILRCHICHVLLTPDNDYGGDCSTCVRSIERSLGWVPEGEA